MQNDMLEKAKAFLASHINDAHDYNEFKAIAETKPALSVLCGVETRPVRTKSKRTQQLQAVVCHLVTRSRFPTYAYAVESRRISSYTGVRHIKRRTKRCA